MTMSSPRRATLHLASGNGPITRSILDTPLRDALPSEIPIIDISPARSPSPSDRAAVASLVRSAATTSGFFYITNHGIPEALTTSARAAALSFFRRPQDEKMRAWAGRSAHFNGYKPPGSLRINKTESVDARETFSWAYDPAYDPGVADVGAIPPEAARFLRAEEFHWRETADIPELKASMVAYWRACLALARVLIRTFALSLDLPEDYFDSKFAYPDATLTLNYYPPMPPQAPDGDAETQVSIGSHTDFQLFTMLWQDESGGLQVLSRDGQWLRAAPVPGTLVVNIADYMQRITNDLYVSTVHRAQNLSGKERVSMPFFFGFGLHETCAVVSSCVREGEEPKYEEIGCADWVRRRVGAMHKTEGAN
ncbi:hypothetical protein B0T11DRAFT_133711 [Plectosphaerella cucumerina]|uniref:Fe2OG dioxygenase domain-containing protein n=1 Tax=Plectosphaerella cucumerina TaxID=40658 RepID=A0A8K0TBX0_9PEZI|nr:hypothetical protein B0T11DRAFT_133711 [Plectosphaerella cucumerina]